MAKKRGSAPAAAAARNHGGGGRERSGSCNSMAGKRKGKERVMLLQDFLYSQDYILSKVFRKDGPQLGVEFDTPPSQAFRRRQDPKRTPSSCKGNQKLPKRRKVVKPVSEPHGCIKKNVPFKKHGMGKGMMIAPVKRHGMGKGPITAPVKSHGVGKGLMTLWRITNTSGGDFPVVLDASDRGSSGVSCASTSKSEKQKSSNKRLRQQNPMMKRLKNKREGKKKSSVKRRKVDFDKVNNNEKMCKRKCELAMVGVGSMEWSNESSELVDDEELELRELQAGPNPLTCSAHFSTSGRHCCSLCKDLLAKFPPATVKMKQPFSMQPWNFSPELVKNLFKVFHFLHTYAVTINIFPFTLDEFVEAFHDKDSLLVGKLHVALLKFLFSSIEMELRNGSIPRISKNILFLGLLQLVERQEFIVKLWNKFLNPLTWVGILHQVLVAAGFGSKEGLFRRERLSKEVDLAVKYGLSLGTLKCAIFSILSEQGSNGMEISQLAKSKQIVDLNLPSTIEELELSISSTLASDITLFEKISSSRYRLRINSGMEEAENFLSDTEDSGSVDDDPRSSDGNLSDCECDSLAINDRQYKRSHSKDKNRITVYTEIDESSPEELWLLGLMEGEYSRLSIEEKLDALLALVDLLSSAYGIIVEDPMNAITEYAPNIHHVGSGAKIKRSSTKEHNWQRTSQARAGPRLDSLSEIRPIDSLALMSNTYLAEKSFSTREDEYDVGADFDLHPLQSVFLGSDRRYNRYWLFLGPCNSNDPGHKRIYFESSEDGHWEVIDTEQALRSLMSALDNRGRREASLLASLENREAFLCQEMSSRMGIDSGTIQLAQSDHSEIQSMREASSSPMSDVDNNLYLIDTAKDSSVSSAVIVNEIETKGDWEKRKWIRLQEFDAWIWNCFYCNLNVVKQSKHSYYDSLMRCEGCHDLYWRDEKHCRICHLTFELDFDLEERYMIHKATCRERDEIDTFPKHKVLPSQLQALKAASHAIESAMPKDALVGAWTKSAHNLWIKRLRRTSSLAELLQVLGDFVGAINKDWLCQSNVLLGSGTTIEEIVAFFPSMPQTSSAVALWLVKLDALIAYSIELVQ